MFDGDYNLICFMFKKNSMQKKMCNKVNKKMGLKQKQKREYVHLWSEFFCLFSNQMRCVLFHDHSNALHWKI